LRNLYKGFEGEMNTIKAMLISVGGTPQPIIVSIKKYSPQFISFFASQQTIDQVLDILNTVHTETGVKIEKEITLVDDVNDLYHCYKKAEEAVSRINKRGYTRDEVIVDYTGGTKNMSVAISLAAITNGFSFSYVGGKERTKNGVGVVINGSEEVYESINPWDFLAIEERKKISILFNTYQFKAAKEIIDTIAEKSTRYKPVFKKLSFIVDGYYQWDMFKHRDALERFRRARMDEIPEEIEFEEIHDFIVDTRKKLSVLESIINSSSNGKRPTIQLIKDLFANAERRFYEGKVDDAILRLYRIVEMVAQLRLLEKYNIDTSDVKEEQIPDSLRDEFIRRYRSSRDGKIMVPLRASFEMLEHLGDDIGKIFVQNNKRFLDIQSARNLSYLAHGFQSAKEQTYIRLKEFISELKLFEEEDIMQFPRMRT